MGLDENEPIQCATLLFTCESYRYCPFFPIQHPAHTSSSTLWYQTVHVREQREGQDLPRLLAGVMHKTDPVVYMQRQKERGEREEINVLIRGEHGEKSQQRLTALLSSNAADTKLWMQLTVASRSILYIF